MSDIVLDASALIAMIKGERGATKVAGAIASSRMSAVNYAEVVSHFAYAGMPDQEIDAMLDPLPLTLVDEALAQSAGRLRAATATAGLSLDDRFCLALALRDGLPAWTADLTWTEVVETVGVKIVTIRGRAG